MQVFLLDLQELSPQAVTHFEHSLPPERAAAAARCRRATQRAQTVLGYILVRYATEQVCGQRLNEDWSYGAHGKPHWNEQPLFFNLTHTPYCVAVVVSEREEVGIDAEVIRPQREGFAARYFSDREQQEIAVATNPDEALIRLWSAKEAEGKRLGNGLLDMQELSLDKVCSQKVTISDIPHWLSVSPAPQFPPISFVHEWDLI